MGNKSIGVLYFNSQKLKDDLKPKMQDMLVTIHDKLIKVARKKTEKLRTDFNTKACAKGSPWKLTLSGGVGHRREGRLRTQVHWLRRKCPPAQRATGGAGPWILGYVFYFRRRNAPREAGEQ